MPCLNGFHCTPSLLQCRPGQDERQNPHARLGHGRDRRGPPLSKWNLLAGDRQHGREGNWAAGPLGRGRQEESMPLWTRLSQRREQNLPTKTKRVTEPSRRVAGRELKRFP